MRVATYNIQYGYGQDGRYDLARIADDVRDVDIICLQEVTTHWNACDGDHQPDKLLQELNLFGVYGPSFELDCSYIDEANRVVNRRRGFGNMVLSRWPIIYSRPHSLARPAMRIPRDFVDPRTDLPRSAVEAIVDVPGMPTRVMSLHLTHLPGEQRGAQVTALHTLLNSLPTEAQLWDPSDPTTEPWTEGHAPPPVVERTILAGDFNFRPDDAEYAAMLTANNGQSFVDGWCTRSSAGTHAATCTELDGSGSTLDYGFFTQDLSAFIVHAEVRDQSRASDHFPLVFELDI